METELSLDIVNKIKNLKSESGTHSPSIDTILYECPELKIDIDACFLSNPYAMELFMKCLREDLIDNNKLRDVLEFYPPQNREVSKNISKAIKVDYRNIFVDNGSIEIIQGILYNFVAKKYA